MECTILAFSKEDDKKEEFKNTQETKGARTREKVRKCKSKFAFP